MNDQKIIPHLWFDHEVQEAAQFYTAIFLHMKKFDIQKLIDAYDGSD